ncbi:imidazole glycerol phosphate synthase subunit HisH [Candidatus Kaistella beijingensis]|uniref:imidazole glycerol phosphate synthase subunit HisH n=1 Tax=Candidatus Kaistella beijingensis TaxID=2820270 RepID=UPI001CC4A9CB|nr:imidazole glycerol phosphate synthase subunit HisH [Candidatus Kaistella beijingensis]UBB90641.1 imidazole glycerol phosphate synthase subunit HisH [Candidatus Kaistella beijingensis]
MIAIIKYNAGNVQSVQTALKRLGVESIVTDNFDEIRNAEKVIFPGVGEASSAMKFLQEKGLDKLIPTLTRPVLGICLGQQLMCNNIEEGDTVGMKIFDVDVKLFPPKDLVPHMGWNSLKNLKNSLFEGISEEDDVYFVHSYYCEISEFTSAVCDYILLFSAGLQRDNFYSTQFHPEKSGSVGAKILQNFLNL